MNDKSKGYSSQEENEENITNEEEENEENEENNDYINMINKNKKFSKNNAKYKNKNEKNIGTNINIIMNETEKDQLILQLKKELKEKELQIK